MSEADFNCQLCGMVFKTKREVKSHQMSKHSDGDVVAANSGVENAITMKTNTKEETAAAKISKTHSNSVLKADQKTKIHQKKQNKSGKKAEKGEIVNSRQNKPNSNASASHEDNPFVNDLSDPLKSMKIVGKAKQNLNSSVEKNISKCCSCNSDSKILVIQKQSTNEETKEAREQGTLSDIDNPAVCSICNKSFRTWRKLHNHTSKSHPHYDSDEFLSANEDLEEGDDKEDNAQPSNHNSKNDDIKPNLTEWRNMGNEISHEITFRLRSTMNGDWRQSPIKWQTMSTGSHVEITKVSEWLHIE